MESGYPGAARIERAGEAIGWVGCVCCRTRLDFGSRCMLRGNQSRSVQVSEARSGHTSGLLSTVLAAGQDERGGEMRRLRGSLESLEEAARIPWQPGHGPPSGSGAVGRCTERCFLPEGSRGMERTVVMDKSKGEPVISVKTTSRSKERVSIVCFLRQVPARLWVVEGPRGFKLGKPHRSVL